jgi:Icc-related predicted phosphoesterase
MRCHYVSDLHLESQSFTWTLPKGDVLIVAGDLCHARCLDPTRADKYSIDQRVRVMCFVDSALANFRHVLLVAGNHEHYDGIFDNTTLLLRKHLPGVVVLDNECIELEGVQFFGSTLWSNFSGRSLATMNVVRKRMGEYFFVKKRLISADGVELLANFRPEDAADAFEESIAALKRCIAAHPSQQTVVITHHAPSRQGLNPSSARNGLEGAYASDLDATIASLANVPVWIHGHTHIRRRYRIGKTAVLANCRGFDGKDLTASSFTPSAHFYI